ncbi:MAG TPA: hypothetical protein VMT93_07525 [Gemmatimonadaceae bacterium]|nr:hypothetical protein [Gemmatimonadaceae bacterium]
MRRLPVILAAGLLAAACSSSDPTAASPTPPNFMQAASTAPPLANATDSFWAVTTRSRRLRIYYHPSEPGEDSSVMMRFSVPAGALFRRPDGTMFGANDSILIHVTVVDPANLVVAFSPAGLQFSATTPAHITFYLGETNEDIDDDGHVSAADSTLLSSLHIWKQESASLPWVQLPSVVDLTNAQVDADIFSFTNYALAY